MEQMSITLLTNFIPPYRLPLYSVLAKKYRDFRILISTYMEPNRNWEIEWGELPITVQKCITLKRNWKDPSGFSEETYIHIPLDTLGYLHQYQPKVIITAELGARTIQATLYKLLHPKSKIILWLTISEYTEMYRSRFRVILRKLLLRKANAVLINGKSGERYISSLSHHCPRTFIVPYTTDLSPFLQIPSKPLQKSPIRLLFVGQLTPRKGILLLIGQLSTFLTNHPEDNVELIIAGDGPLRSSIQGQPLPRNFHITVVGNIPYKQISSIYANADYLVFPTLADEWGLVVNEAMASGLPVIGSKFSQAVEELVIPGINGWIFDPKEIRDVETCLFQAFSISSDAYSNMSHNARKTATSLSIDNVADRLEEAINYVVHGR